MQSSLEVPSKSPQSPLKVPSKSPSKHPSESPQSPLEVPQSPLKAPHPRPLKVLQRPTKSSKVLCDSQVSATEPKDFLDLGAAVLQYYTKAYADASAKKEEDNEVGGEVVALVSGGGGEQLEKPLSQMLRKGGLKHTVTAVLIPKEADLEARRNFSYAMAPHKKKLKAGDYVELAIEHIVFATAEPLDGTPFQFRYLPPLLATSWAMPVFAPVPLYHPSDLFMVYPDEKKHIYVGPPVQSIGSGGVSQVAPRAFESSGDGDKVIAYHGDRHHHTYAEFDNLLGVKRKIVLTVGNGTILKGSAISKTTTIAIFRNRLHRDLVMNDLKAWLAERIADPQDVRFYREPPNAAQSAQGSVDQTSEMGESNGEVPRVPSERGTEDRQPQDLPHGSSLSEVSFA